MPDLLTVREVAELLRINEAYFRDSLSKRRGFPAGPLAFQLVPEVGSEQLDLARLSAAMA